MTHNAIKTRIAAMFSEGTKQVDPEAIRRRNAKKNALRKLYKTLSKGEFEFDDRKKIVSALSLTSDSTKRKELGAKLKRFLQVQAEEKAFFVFQWPPGEMIRKQKPGNVGDIFRKLLQQLQQQMTRRQSHR